MHRSRTHSSRALAWFAAVAGWGLCGCFTDPGQQLVTHGGGASTSEATGESTSEADTGDGPTTGALGVCGDARTDPGEACDFGEFNNGVEGNLCKADCTRNVCGDGYLASTEGCDDGNLADGDGCSQSCVADGCGDGVVGPGEECDDGNQVDTDGCSGACTLPFCGDGVLGETEACDEGAGNGDDQACTLTCNLAACGDGVVLAGVEECDDGNLLDGDGCNSRCELPRCGDGVIDEGEACDDGNLADGDTCSASCERLAFTVFVTSAQYDGAFGGVEQADAHCNSLASAGALPGAGKYLAWLSGGELTPAKRFHPSLHPYRRVDGVTIAVDWKDLVDGELLAPIAVDEGGAKFEGGGISCLDLASIVWTATSGDGSQNLPNCDGWSGGDAKGSLGSALAFNKVWTAACALPCTVLARLYCFEQP